MRGANLAIGPRRGWQWTAIYTPERAAAALSTAVCAPSENGGQDSVVIPVLLDAPAGPDGRSAAVAANLRTTSAIWAAIASIA